MVFFVVLAVVDFFAADLEVVFFAGADLDEAAVVFFAGAGLDEAVVVFFVVAGFEARFRFDAEGLAFSAAVVLDAEVFRAAFRTAFESGSVFREAEAGTGGGGEAGAEAICLAASRQFGKKSSIRWREMELARRQRGQWAS